LIQPWLEGVFKGLPGESRVSNGHFAMFTQRNNVTGPEIPADVWEHSVFPGDQVVMSVRTAGVTQKGHCQRCGQMLSSPPAMPDWSECLGCDRWLYRVLHPSSLWARRHGSAHHDEVTSEGAFHIDWNDCDDGHEFRCRDNAFKRRHWYYSDLERVARARRELFE